MRQTQEASGGISAGGNPDTAAHTGVYVPGTGTTMDSTAGGVSRTDRLRGTAGEAGADGAVSTVLWLGYDAPVAGRETDLRRLRRR